MIQKVNFRDRQEVQAADLNNVQGFADATLQALILDAITGERMFSGLQVTMKSATELEIAPGRLWAGDLGKIFRKAAAEVLSIFSYLPVQDQKYLCLSVLGQEQDAAVQPRDFLIDLQSGQTEPRAVAMEKDRVAAVQATAGLESAEPQKPAAPTGYTPIAMVLLNASGIVSVELAENKRLMRLFDVWQGMKANAEWIAAAAPKLASLLSDVASLGAKAAGQESSPALLYNLAAEVALLRQKMQLPATYLNYDADTYQSTTKSDAASVGYLARVLSGLRFPNAGETEKALALFNPYETKVQNFGGLILPAHALVARLATTGLAGELPLADHQYQTTTYRALTRTRVRTVYSPAQIGWTQYDGVVYRWESAGERAKVIEETFDAEVPAGVSLGESKYVEQQHYSEPKNADGTSTGWYAYAYRDVWRKAWQETYTVLDSTTSTINGALSAQTYLSGQNGWLRKIGLPFTRKAATGPVTMLLCDTINGLPNMERTLGVAVVQPGDIQDAGETLFEFAKPVFIKAGNRYAIVLITSGAHAVALVQGTQYSQGSLFHSTDGVYFQGDFTKDLMMTHYYASFSNPRTVVDLDGIDLSGGIAAFDLLTEQIEPDATSLSLEYQPSGSGDWVPIVPGTTDSLLALPALCRLRAVFNGSTDLMPGIDIGTSKIRAQRPGTAFKHISTARNLGQASDDIDVILRLENWNGARHSCTVKLLSGGNTYAGTVKDEAVDAKTLRRVVTFTPNAPAGITTYKVQIEGVTTSALDCFHVSQRMDVAK